jgi:molybdopterin-guanine dinucleotide biosynthesis protein
VNHRSVIQVVGPPSSGKTLLIERLLRSNRSRTIGALRVTDLEGPGGAAAPSTETERYTAAGAAASDWFALPGDAAGSVWAALEACDDKLFGCDAILVEGGPTTRRDVDGIVFVAPPLGSGETLLLEETREVHRIDGRDALLLMLGVDPESVEDTPDFDDDEGEVIETFELPDDAAAAITRLLEHGMPVVRSGPWLRPGWERLAAAELAVVNARAEHDADAARETLRSLEALRTDSHWHTSLIPRQSDPGPRRSFLADLANPRDREARRLIEAIKRRWI